jgi:UDP-N-acetyl-2-amino-2-deoxyglucuronate dehydrogenase
MPQKQQRFAIIGVGGYIAPRHLKAIKDTGNTVIAALDPHDSVGLLDSFFPNTQFFTEFERFDRHAEKLKRQDEDGAIQYVSICSPNYLHDAHIRFALRIGAHAICEKPLVLNPWNIDALKALEDEYGKRVYTILQLRVHPVLKKLKAEIEKQSSKEKHTVELTYITSRGAWYLNSWKGQSEKSGGLATNIGIHFFDLLIWLFGPVKLSEVYSATDKETSGYLELENANVRWFLSIDEHKLPQDAIKNGKRTFRSLTVDKKEIEFSEGFTDLHTVVQTNLRR